MNTRWLLRAKRLAQNPPSWGRVKLVLGVIALCLLIVGAEHFLGDPSATVPRQGLPRVNP